MQSPRQRAPTSLGLVLRIVRPIVPAASAVVGRRQVKCYAALSLLRLFLNLRP